MANVSTAADMVAADQLFKSALQTINVSISDKNQEIGNTLCAQLYLGPTKINCDECPLSNTCKSKNLMAQLKSDLESLTQEKTQLLNKYIELQDNIKTFLLS